MFAASSVFDKKRDYFRLIIVEILVTKKNSSFSCFSKWPITTYGYVLVTKTSSGYSLVAILLNKNQNLTQEKALFFF